MKSEKLTIEWMISMLSQDGINSKKIVRERLKNMTKEDALDLNASLREKYIDIIDKEIDNILAKRVGKEE